MQFIPEINRISKGQARNVGFYLSLALKQDVNTTLVFLVRNTQKGGRQESKNEKTCT